LKNNRNKRFRVQSTRCKPGFSGVVVFLIISCTFFIVPSFTSCNIYKFNEATIPDSIKTVKIKYIENKAQYNNPQLSPNVKKKLKQTMIGQKRLSQTNGDNPDWEISGTITQYSFSTSAISGQQVATNRLSISVHITLNDRKADDVKDFDVSRSFEFKGNLSFQQAEAGLMDEITRTLTDEIFNKLFSNW